MVYMVWPGEHVMVWPGGHNMVLWYGNGDLICQRMRISTAHNQDGYVLSGR